MDEQRKQQLRSQLEQWLQSTIVAFGNQGTVLNSFVNNFSTDWSHNLSDLARQLGFVQPGFQGIVAMLRTFPQFVHITEMQNGQIHLRPVASEQTKGNIGLITKSNKAVADEEREYRGRSRVRPIPVHINLSAMLAPTQSAQHPAAAAKPKPPGLKEVNPNMVPLGPLRLPFTQQNQNLPQQPQRSRTSSRGNQRPAPSGRRPMLQPFNQAVRNDFGDVLRNPPPYWKSSVKASQADENLQKGASSSSHYQPDSYYDEDFRAPPSHQSEHGSKDSTCQGSPEPPVQEEEGKKKEKEEQQSDDEEDDEDEEECEDDFSETESEYDYDVEFDEDNEVDDNTECSAFLNDTVFGGQIETIPPGQQRILHIFRMNGGTLSPDDLKKAYLREFNAALTCMELNRLLGSPENLKVAKASFKKCAYPASTWFTIIERTSGYVIQLKPSLADNAVDTTIFFQGFSKAHAVPASVTSSPLPSTPATPSTVRSAVPAHKPAPPKSMDATPKSTPKPVDATPKSSKEKAANFEQFAILAHAALLKANGTWKSLDALFNRLKALGKKSQDDEFPADKWEFLGYLHQFFASSFHFAFQGDQVMLSAKSAVPKKFTDLPSSPGTACLYTGLRTGDIHQVKLLSFNGASGCNNVILRLVDLAEELETLLREYAEIIDEFGENPADLNAPNRPVFFFHQKKQLCRGKFVRKDGEERAIVTPFDKNGEDRYVYIKDIYELPVNFPGWRFPPCEFKAQLEGQKDDLVQLWKRGQEFTVKVCSVTDGKYKLKIHGALDFV